MSQRKSHKQKNLGLKEFWEIFHDIENTKDKIMKADLSLERVMRICQNREHMLALYHELCDEKKSSTVETTFDKFFF